MVEITLLQHLELLEAIPPWERDKDNAETIRRGLVSDDPRERILALGLVAETLGAEDAQIVIAILNGDSDDEVRARAAIALGPALAEYFENEGFFEDDSALDRAAYDTVVTTLRSNVEGDSNPMILRRRSLEAAIRSPQDWQLDSIRRFYESGDKDQMITAIFCAGFVKDLESYILDNLDSTDDEIQYQAVVAVHEAYCEKAFPKIVELAFESADQDVQLAAVEALGHMPNRKARPVLDELAESDDGDISTAAEYALEELMVFG